MPRPPSQSPACTGVPGTARPARAILRMRHAPRLKALGPRVVQLSRRRIGERPPGTPPLPRCSHGRVRAWSHLGLLQPAGVGRVAGAAGSAAGRELPGREPWPLRARPVGRQPGLYVGPRPARRRRSRRARQLRALDARLLRRAPRALRARREHVRPLPGERCGDAHCPATAAVAGHAEPAPSAEEMRTTGAAAGHV